MTPRTDLELPAGFSKDAPLIDTFPIRECTVCGGAEREHYASGHDYEIETCSNRWDFWRCLSCRAVWLDPRPSIGDLPVIYPPTYYAYQMATKVSPIAMRGKAALDALKFKRILRATGGTPRTYLDIGCGSGRYLEWFAEKGLPRKKIYGLELSEETIRELSGRGFNAHCARVEDCTAIPDGSIDLATMFHVIEHVDDPRRVVRRISDWLSPGGHLVLETPNTDSLDARLFQGRWWGGLHIPRHWTLFDEPSLRRLLEDSGLKVVSIGYQTGHSFWMYSLHHLTKYNRRRPSPRLARMFDPLRGLPFLVAFTGFDTIRRLMGMRTSAILVVARKVS